MIQMDATKLKYSPLLIKQIPLDNDDEDDKEE